MADEHIPYAGINLEILKILSDWSDDIMKQPLETQWEFYYRLKDDIVSRWGSVTLKEIGDCFKGDDLVTIQFILGHPQREIFDIHHWKLLNKKTILKLLTLWVIISSTTGSKHNVTLLRQFWPLPTVMRDLWDDQYGMNEDMTDGVLGYISDDLRLITGRRAINKVEHWSWASELWDTGTALNTSSNPAPFFAHYNSEVEKLYTSHQAFFMNWKSNPFK